MRCRGCNDVGGFYYHEVRIYNVRGSRGDFRIAGYGTTLYSADWTAIDDLCPAVSIRLVLGAIGPVALGQNWMTANRVNPTGDKHPITFAGGAASFTRKTVTLVSEWLRVESLDLVGTSFWIPQGVLTPRGDASSVFGKEYDGLRVARSGTAVATVRPFCRKGDDFETGVALSDAEWATLETKPFVILGQYYEMSVDRRAPRPNKTVYLDPAHTRHFSRQNGAKRLETSTQYLYLADTTITDLDLV